MKLLCDKHRVMLGSVIFNGQVLNRVEEWHGRGYNPGNNTNSMGNPKGKGQMAALRLMRI